jgi:hypothetical protein
VRAAERDPPSSVDDSYRDLTPEPLELPPLEKSKYVRPPIQEQNFIPSASVCEPKLVWKKP